MLNRMVYLLVFVSGLMLGVGSCYFYFYQASNQYLGENELVEKVISYADTSILDENYACEGKPVKTVGAVVASLIELNTINKVDSLVSGCFEDTCTMSVSDCSPWEGSECSTRFLKVNLDSNHQIKPTTFTCFDMP